MSIQQYLDKIKNAVYGREVRGAIHDAIKQTYDDASEGGDANMEVSLARGNFPTLGDRLNSVDSQLAHKANENEVRKKSVPIDLDDVSDRFLAAVEGGEGTSFNLLSVPRDNSVSPRKTTFVTPGKNLFDRSLAFHGKQISLSDGSLIDSPGNFVTDFIPVSPGDVITLSHDYRVGFYGPDGNNIEVLNTLGDNTRPRTVTIPEGARYLRASAANHTIGYFQIEHGEEATDYEPYYNNINSKAADDVEKYVHGFRNTVTELIRENGQVVAIKEKKGNKVIGSTSLIRDLNGNVIGATEAFEGRQVSVTINKDLNGNLTSVSREVI